MLERLEKQKKLTANQWKIIATANVGDMLDFFDFFLIGFVLAFVLLQVLLGAPSGRFDLPPPTHVFLPLNPGVSGDEGRMAAHLGKGDSEGESLWLGKSLRL